MNINWFYSRPLALQLLRYFFNVWTKLMSNHWRYRFWRCASKSQLIEWRRVKINSVTAFWLTFILSKMRIELAVKMKIDIRHHSIFLNLFTPKRIHYWIFFTILCTWNLSNKNKVKKRYNFFKISLNRCSELHKIKLEKLHEGFHKTLHLSININLTRFVLTK